MPEMGHLNYLPLTLPFFAVLVAVFVALVVFIEIRALRYAYLRLGVSSRAAMLLLLASLFGSYINIPVAQLPERQVRSGQVITSYGMQYVIPSVTEWPGTVIAVNVGGAIVPAVLSLYLLSSNRIWRRGLVATASWRRCVTTWRIPSRALALRSRPSCHRSPRRSSRWCCRRGTPRRWLTSAAVSAR